MICLLSKTQTFMSTYVTFSSKDYQKLSKVFSKAFGRSVYWNEYKTKSGNESTTNEYRYFPESNFVGLNRLFALVYSKQDNNQKGIKYLGIIYQKALLTIITSLSRETISMANPLILI